MPNPRVVAAIQAVLCFGVLGLALPQSASDDAHPTIAPVHVPVHRTLVPLFFRSPDGEPARDLKLTLDDLKVTVAGKKILTSAEDSYSLDVECGNQETGLSASDRRIRHVVVVVDLHFVDMASRFRVADALDGLIEASSKDPVYYAVLVVTNRVIPLTPGFVPAGRRLRIAAAGLRALTFAPDSPSHPATVEWTPPIDRSFRAEFARVFLAAFGAWGGRLCGGTLPREFIQASLHGIPVLGQEAGLRAEAPARSISEGIAPEGRLSQREVTGYLGGLNTGRGPAMGYANAPMGFANEQSAPEYMGDVIVGRDIGPSVRAILAISRAYAAVPSPKWLVLFSGEAFRSSRDSKNDAAVSALLEAAALRFTVWTVDAAGIGRRQSGASELLSSMALDSGGLVIRGTNDLGTVFERVGRSSGCYALLGIPPTAGLDRQDVPFDVAIDTERRPDLWGYRIAAPRVVRLHSREGASEAALTEARSSEGALSSVSIGGGFVWPESQEAGAKLGLLVEVEAPVDRPTDGYVVDLTVAVEHDRDGSVRTVTCIPSGASVSSRLRVRGARPLVAAYECDFVGAGRYRATVTVVEPEGGRVGARGFALWIPGGEGAESLQVPYAAVLVKRDDAVIWRPTGSAPNRDSAGTPALSPTDGEFPAGCASEVVLVACGADRTRWLDRTSVTLVRWDIREGTGEMAGVIPASRLVRWKGVGSPECDLVRAAIPPFSLHPGDYAWLVEATGADPSAPPTALAEGVFTIQ